MNTQSNTTSEFWSQSRGFRTAVVAAARPVYWSIRRELWENRSIYIAPLAASVLFLCGSLISTVRLRLHMEDPWKSPHGLTDQFELAPALIMGTALIVGVFYCLDALYGERRDRSILFWKSLPVSDVAAVLSKLAVPVVILPLLSFLITVATEFIMLGLTSVVFAGSGANIRELWTASTFLRLPLIWLYHLLTVHGLWYAPIYAWLLMVSAWAPRAPVLWAFLPPFVIWGVEKIAFNTSYFLGILQYRLTGPASGMVTNNHSHDVAATLIPHHFLSTPGLWTGFLVATVFLFITVRLRRSRGPI